MGDRNSGRLFLFVTPRRAAQFSSDRLLIFSTPGDFLMTEALQKSDTRAQPRAVTF